MSFKVNLPLFEGPFDLLLFFIERDELDIYDIPISKITNDFLDYLHNLEAMNMEVASEFILVAATLMRIKAKMLLPRPQLDEDGNEVDPREELIKHLLEYKKYKSVVATLASMEKDRMDMESRGNVMSEVKQLAESVNVESELQSIDLYKLLKVYMKVLNRFDAQQNQPKHEVIQYPYTISDKKKEILNLITINGKVPFIDLINQEPNKISVIFNFLAILEMLQQKLIYLHLGMGYNNFWIEKLEQNEFESEK